jgi:hypothetical protein
MSTMSELPIWAYSAITIATLLGMSAIVYAVAGSKRNRVRHEGQNTDGLHGPVKARPQR